MKSVKSRSRKPKWVWSKSNFIFIQIQADRSHNEREKSYGRQAPSEVTIITENDQLKHQETQ